MKTINTYVLPFFYQHALIDGDFTGLNRKEAKDLHQWILNVSPGKCIGCSNRNPYHSKNNDMSNEPGLVREYRFREN